MEVHHNGVWGTVCDDGWDLREAEVVCTELGLGEAVATIPSAFYGQGSGQIWLDDVDCVGTEETIGNCSHSGWRSHNCSHENDVSVNCTTGTYGNFIGELYTIVFVCIYSKGLAKSLLYPSTLSHILSGCINDIWYLLLKCNIALASAITSHYLRTNSSTVIHVLPTLY